MGKCAELIEELGQIMCLPEIPDDGDARVTVMPRFHYNLLTEDELKDFNIFYERKAVRLFHNKSVEKWLMVFPEDILEEQQIRIVLMWLLLRPFYLNCISKGALPVHASSAELNGKAVIIAASGDTGKTTTVRRLPEPWREIGDDSAIILPYKEGFRVHAMPTWSEFIYGRSSSLSWDLSEGIELACIFFLKQSEDDRTEKLSPVKSLMSLYKSSMEAIAGMEKNMLIDNNKKLFHTVSEVTQKVPACILHATLSGKVWESIEEAMN
jgi:SynChlorMet cassette protein ScmC